LSVKTRKIRRRRVFLFLCALTFSPLLILLTTTPVADYAHAVSNYRSYDDAGMVALQSMYNSTTGLWSNALWWQQANALETTIDYTLLTGTHDYTGDIATTFNTYKIGAFFNSYYDDEGWWSLAWIKAYDLTGNVDYLNAAKSIFSDMSGGWDSTCGGGIWWTKSKTYKNAITNELFLEVAARLHQLTPGDAIGSGGGPGNTSYIDWASREWSWFKSSGMLNSSNLINDGLDSTTCRNNGQTTWTYNQGVILGALADMYRITGDLFYLAQAEAIADANIAFNVDDKHILYEKGCESSGDCGNDGPQFKGIFMQNLAYLFTLDNKQPYKQFILKNAAAIWAHDRDNSNNLGLHWDGPFSHPGVSSQSSAVDALTAAVLVLNSDEQLATQSRPYR
jgi:predicted alpha-1,6-mannanase (GH76 family)